jgi:nucleoside phosphorylase
MLVRSGVAGDRGFATVGILTVTHPELAAARTIFGLNNNLEGSPYYVSEFTNQGRYPVVLKKCDGRGNTQAFGAVRDLIEDFRPHFLILIGTAGGITGREAQLGDVILADFIEYSEYMKLTDGKVLLRREPLDYPSKYLRGSVAEPLMESNWHLPLGGIHRPLAGQPKVVVGQLISTEKILSDADNQYQKTVLDAFDKGVAVEMESMGFARGLFDARWSVDYNPQGLVIRGISDIVDAPGANEVRQQWTNYASHAAACFAKSVVDALMRSHGKNHQPPGPVDRFYSWWHQ